MCQDLREENESYRGLSRLLRTKGSLQHPQIAGSSQPSEEALAAKNGEGSRKETRI